MNVAEQADKFLKTVENGFNGVPVVTLQRESIWHEQYAIFVLQFDTDMDRYGKSEYHTQSFDYGAFERDFNKHMKKFFPNCKINYSEGCFEYEVCGPKCSEFFKEHSDKLEELELDRDGHLVYNTR